MSLFNSIKRAFGFSGDDEDDDDLLYADTTPSAQPASAEPQPAAESRPAAPSEPVKVEFDPAVRSRIFDRVVETFNSALPDFLGRSVDPAAQRDLLLQGLDADIRAYLDSLMQTAREACQREFEDRQNALSAELEAVRKKSAELEKQSADTKQKQLSADRQKRALADRVHDLEATVERLEADREQFELENRSLVNRLKVAGVQSDDIEASQAEITRLKEEIKSLREGSESTPQSEIEDLRRQAAEAEALRSQVADMTEGMAALKEQQRLADEMLADQRQRTAAAEKDAAEKCALVESARADLAETSEKLKEANSLLDGFNEIASKMDEIDKALTSREAKIKQQKKTIAARDAEIESLRHTIAENLRLQAEREKALRAETEALQAKLDALNGQSNPYAAAGAEKSIVAEPAADSSDSDAAPIISESDLSDLEKTFESEEWFTKTPPPETPSMRSPEAEAEFGYHPPKRRPNPGNHPDQLSLF